MPVMSQYKHGQFSWVDLNAHDAQASARFYSGLFGWNAIEQDTGGGPPYWIFELNGKQVAGMGQMSDEMKSQGAPPLWNSYVNVDNCQEIENRVAELGGNVLIPRP